MHSVHVPGRVRKAASAQFDMTLQFPIQEKFSYTYMTARGLLGRRGVPDEGFRGGKREEKR